MYYYFEIQSLYASTECIDRGLNPETCNFVVWDKNDNAVLDVTPSLKKYKNNIPAGVKYGAVSPRVDRYIEMSRQVLRVLLKFFSAEDIYPCSMTGFMVDYKSYWLVYNDYSVISMAEKVIDSVFEKTGLRVKAGYGVNMYLARVAADLIAGSQVSKNVGVLTKELFICQLWNHTPLTDFYDITPSVAKHLTHLGVSTMEDISRLSLEEVKAELGEQGEVLWNHSVGEEYCTFKDIKNSEKRTRDLTDTRLTITGDCNGVYLILKVMADNLVTELIKHKLYAGEINLRIEYQDGKFSGDKRAFEYVTCSRNIIVSAFVKLYWHKVNELIPIRQIGISLSGLKYKPDNSEVS